MAGPDPSSEPEALEPEELSVSAQKEAANDGLFDVFDRRTVQCLFSKTWALREQALHSIAEGYAELQCEKGAALRGTCYVLRRVFQVIPDLPSVFTLLKRVPRVPNSPLRSTLQMLTKGSRVPGPNRAGVLGGG